MLLAHWFPMIQHLLAKEASFEQTYYVYDSVGTVRAGVVRAYCTVTGECSGNTGEQIF